MIHRARKVDANQLAITKALRDAGCCVVDLSAVGRGCPDLAICNAKGGGMTFMEVKNKKGKGDKLTPAQVKFHAEWKGWIHRVTTVDEALAAMGIVRITPAEVENE